MKQFNKVISVEVSVDSIAKRLLDTLPEDYKHRELVAEAIIGPMVSNDLGGSLGALYNSLNGFVNEINFAKDDVVDVTDGYYQSYPIVDGKILTTGKNIKTGLARIIEVDVYRFRDQIQVEWPVITKKGGTDYVVDFQKRWIDKKEATKCADDIAYQDAISEMKKLVDNTNTMA